MKQMNTRRLTYASNFYIGVFGFQLTMMSPLLEKMSASFGLSLAQTGSLFSFSAAGFATAIIGASILSDRIGKEKIVIWSAFGFALSLLLFSISQWFLTSVMLFFIAGGFGGILESMLSAVVAEINPGREERSVTITQVFFGLGAIAGPSFGGWLVGTKYPWQSAYFVAGFLALVSSLWIYRYKFPSLKVDEKMKWRVIQSILKNRRFLLLCASVALYVGVETSVWGWTPKYLTSELHFDYAAAGRMVAFLWAAITVGRLVTAWLSHKWSNRVLVIALCLVAAAGLVIMPWHPSQTIVIIAFFLIGFGFSGIWPLLVSHSSVIFAKRYIGTSFGLAVASGGIGSMSIPYLLGWISETTSIGLLLGTLSLLMLAIMAIYSHVIAREKTSESNHKI